MERLLHIEPVQFKGVEIFAQRGMQHSYEIAVSTVFVICPSISFNPYLLAVSDDPIR